MGLLGKVSCFPPFWTLEYRLHSGIRGVSACTFGIVSCLTSLFVLQETHALLPAFPLFLVIRYRLAVPALFGRPAVDLLLITADRWNWGIANKADAFHTVPPERCSPLLFSPARLITGAISLKFKGCGSTHPRGTFRLVSWVGGPPALFLYDCITPTQTWLSSVRGHEQCTVGSTPVLFYL